MTYSNTAIVALFVHCIVNYNALTNQHYRNNTPAGKAYRWLMLSVAVFYVFDALWGVLYDAQLITAVFADTVLYFFAMSATVFVWSRFVINYLPVDSWLIKALKYIGYCFIAFVAAILILNFFLPVVFWFDENGEYHAGNLRYVILAMQIVLFLFSACYVLFTTKGKDKSEKRHHWAVGVFGIAMTIMVIMQVIYPLLPMYSIGCLLGTCILHTFVLEDLKEDRRLELEEMVRREEEHQQELGSAKKLAYKDPLTGVKNKHAYAEWEVSINEAIEKGEQEPFAVVVCDINGLKTVNDLYGHKEGDYCIRKACAKICGVFSHSPVFRIGGDEFVILLFGGDYTRRKELMKQINTVPQDLSEIREGETVSAGIAEYNKDEHGSLLSVFEDADKVMYERKQFLKESLSSVNTSSDGIPASKEVSVMHARKHILIADDIESNREIMGDLLREDYDISYAADGVETLEVLRNHKDEINLVLLDLQMPNKDGREVLAEMQVDEELMSVPVVVLTIDQQSELDCLRIGAMDFIPKPYPNIEIVKARIAKCIELAEDRDLIQYTERDNLTGLLNKDYFYRYVTRLDHLYKDTTMDAVVCDINRFYSVNKQYGRQFGELVLSKTGACMRNLAEKTGGIGCREGGDTFLLYCPHQKDYEKLFKEFLAEVYTVEEISDRISIRFGVFADAQQEAGVKERFDRAKTAAEQVKKDPQIICGIL